MAFKDFIKELGQVFLETVQKKIESENKDYENGIRRYESMSDDELKTEYQRRKSDITSSVGRARAFKEEVERRKENRN